MSSLEQAAVVAGFVSTAVFVGSSLPMLAKAARTRDLDSYSRGQLVLATAGNVINSAYVFSLPVGPIWFLHLFNLACTVIMLSWHLQYAGRPSATPDQPHRVDDDPPLGPRAPQPDRAA